MVAYRRTGGLAARAALVAASIVLSLLLLELACRLVRLGPAGLAHWPNLARERMGNSADGAGSCSYAYDAQVGWTSPPNCASAGYNVDADGFRKTNAPSELAEPPILVTGSSFAKGEEVADDESWPAYLQDMTRRRVLNAGVGGYSLDQSVLRTEQLVRQVKPLLVIVSFTPEDVPRSEFKVAWSREKPYFTAADGRLELHNVPVPGRPGAPVPQPLASRLLGWSALAELVADRLSIFDGWYYTETPGAPRGSGAAVGCLLMQRLAGLGVPVVVLAEYSRGHWMAGDAGKARDFAKSGPVLACAEKAGLTALSLAEPLKPAIAKRGVDALFRSDHHSAEGNRATAEAILQELNRRHLLPQKLTR
jgi:hypothetical protein